MSTIYDATHWETIHGMTDIRCPCHKGRKSRPAKWETPNLLRQMHLSESSVFVRAEMAKLVHSEALLFSSWAAWWDGAQSMLSLFSLYPQHTPEISAPSHIFWRQAERSLSQILSLVPLRISSLEANIWSWESMNREHWRGIGALWWNTCDLMWCIIIKSRSLCANQLLFEDRRNLVLPYKSKALKRPSLWNKGYTEEPNLTCRDHVHLGKGPAHWHYPASSSNTGKPEPSKSQTSSPNACHFFNWALIKTQQNTTFHFQH